ncbi:MAG: ABC transporter substrate-binding protein [Ignavibacteriae bacterium]|nr:ABC transporter substrate-binding protein [Ignavibacteriota bacterium]
MRVDTPGAAHTAAIIALALLIGSSGGCGSRRAPGDRANSRIVRDDLGRAVRIPEHVRRIVTLAPNLTEIICALGAEPDLVGVTSYCDYPPSVAHIPRVGDMIAPSIEAIVGLAPDIVFVTVEGNTRDAHDQMTRLGLRTFVSNPHSFDGILKTLSDAGEILHREARAARLVDSLGAIRRAVADRAREHAGGEAPSVLLIVSLDPLIVAGRGSFIDEMMTIAGARNAGAAAVGRYPVVGREEVLRANPDCILLSNDVAVDAAGVLDHFPEWKKLRAARTRNIRVIDADVFLRPGPRVFSGLRVMRDLLDDITASSAR